jgi:hypothetical protein
MAKEREEEEIVKDNQKFMEGTSLYLFSIENPVRRFIYLLVNKTWFDYLILVAILVSTISLAIESPHRDPESAFSYALYYLDILMTIIFVVEALVKILAFGFIMNGKESYLMSPWNIMDFIIVLFSVISL